MILRRFIIILVVLTFLFVPSCSMSVEHNETETEEPADPLTPLEPIDPSEPVVPSEPSAPDSSTPEEPTTPIGFNATKNILSLLSDGIPHVDKSSSNYTEEEFFFWSEDRITYTYDRITDIGTFEFVLAVGSNEVIASGNFHFDGATMVMDSIGLSPELSNSAASEAIKSAVEVKMLNTDGNALKAAAVPVEFYHTWEYETSSASGEISKYETNDGIYEINAVLRIPESGETYFFSLDDRSLISCYDLRTTVELPSLIVASTLCKDSNDIADDISVEARDCAETVLIEFVLNNFEEI